MSSSTVRFQTSSTTAPSVGQGHWVDDPQLLYNDVPFKNLIDALVLPSTIGTAIAASAAFTILSADSLLGDDSPEGLDRRKEMVVSLVSSTALFAIATAITICLQALYGGPPFCQILIKKLNRDPEKRTPFEPWPSWDFMRYVIAYSVVLASLLALVLHLAATMLIIEVFKPYGPALITQLLIGCVFAVGIAAWGISVVLEMQEARLIVRKLLLLPPEPLSPAQPTVQAPQIELETQAGAFSYRRRNASI
ncbi:hypothetical protein M407DRAFT_18695 [Tulasnella calospora MUT 4182]|uniref:Uncharacterized protein n=1 Tax=Tulasnella calospora MUT 4182 TaxID=1051891 RepID=A0A0C3LEP4_9AGAM|nr:hypothetical protein M407DRAFT_18695 [Tulasnella calospora MUT 4182]